MKVPIVLHYPTRLKSSLQVKNLPTNPNDRIDRTDPTLATSFEPARTISLSDLVQRTKQKPWEFRPKPDPSNWHSCP